MTYELQREVVVARRRKSRRWVAGLIGIALPAQALTLMYVLQPREHIVPAPLPIEHTVNVPLVVPLVVPLDRATCPPPRTDAWAGKPAALPEAILHVRPSDTNADWVAAWNTQHVFISTDGGASWNRRLDSSSDVQDVTFDCFGRAIVLRGNFVGVRDGDVERWAPVTDLHPLDGETGNDEADLLGGGPDIVVVGHRAIPDEPWNAHLFVSRDLGTTWQQRQITGHWEGGVHGRQHEDGTVLGMVSIPDCMSEMAFVFRWKDGVFELIDTQLSADLAFFGDRMVSSTGWQRIGSDETHELPKLVDDDWPRLIAGGPDPTLLGAGSAWRLDGARLTKLPWQFNGDEEHPVADPIGRIWSVMCGQPHRATRTKAAPCPPGNDGEN